MVIAFLLVLMLAEGSAWDPNTAFQTNELYHEVFTTEPEDHTFRISPLNCTTSMIFNITSCYGGRIVLSNTWTFTNSSYTVTLGELRAGSYWSDIITDISAGSFQGNPLKCGDCQPYWMSWNASLVQIGHGDVLGYLNFLRVSVDTDFYYFGFSSQTTAKWEVDINTDGCS